MSTILSVGYSSTQQLRITKIKEMRMEEVDAQNAVDQTGFGKFNLKITALCALIYLNTSICITSTGFVIPAAACDFQMTTLDKGRINAAPMLGMLVGSLIWGYVADLKGRKLALLLALLLQCVFDALAAVIPNYWAFVFLKFVSGIGITGQLSSLFTFLGEFQPTKYRNRILSWMELSWAIGVVLLPLVAWSIIPLKFKYKVINFVFSSWNLFVLVGTIPAVFIATWLATLPETPKYLAENGRMSELLEVLTRMYTENTGKPASEFRELLASCPLPSISRLVTQSTEDLLQKVTTQVGNFEQLRQMVQSSRLQALQVLREPYNKRLVLTGTVMFCMTSTYYSFMTWFPELFQRFASFENTRPGELASVCTVSKRDPPDSDSIGTSHIFPSWPIEPMNDPFGCDVSVDTSVYVNSMWLGIACIPGAVCLPLTVDRLGYRVYLLITTSISGAVIIGLFFVTTSQQNLILSCVFEALTSLSISVVFCLLVELFPTNLRVMAALVTIFGGRCGSLFGNMLFGYLIDDYCLILIIVIAAQLFLCTAVSWIAPGRDMMRKIQGFQS